MIEAEAAAAVGFEDGKHFVGGQAWSAVPDGPAVEVGQDAPAAAAGPALPPAGWDGPEVELVSSRVA